LIYIFPLEHAFSEYS
jgi:hypothetical protein